MRFTDKTTLTLTRTHFFCSFRHASSSIAASIVQLVYVIPLPQTRASQSREVSAKAAVDILALHNVCLSVCGSRKFSENRGTCFKPCRIFNKYSCASLCLSVCGSRKFSENRGTCFKPCRIFKKYSCASQCLSVCVSVEAESSQKTEALVSKLAENSRRF